METDESRRRSHWIEEFGAFRIPKPYQAWTDGSLLLALAVANFGVRTANGTVFWHSRPACSLSRGITPRLFSVNDAANSYRTRPSRACGSSWAPMSDPLPATCDGSTATLKSGASGFGDRASLEHRSNRMKTSHARTDRARAALVPNQLIKLKKQRLSSPVDVVSTRHQTPRCRQVSHAAGV